SSLLRSPPPSPPFPYTTLFRSRHDAPLTAPRAQPGPPGHPVPLRLPAVRGASAGLVLPGDGGHAAARRAGVGGTPPARGERPLPGTLRTALVHAVLARLRPGPAAGRGGGHRLGLQAGPGRRGLCLSLGGGALLPAHGLSAVVELAVAAAALRLRLPVGLLQLHRRRTFWL